MYLKIILSVVVLSIFRFITKFYLARQEVWNLQRANLPMPEFETLTGHFGALKQTISGMPPNATLHSIMLKLSQHFPSGMFYINMWPFSGTWLIVARPSAASQIQSLNLTKPEILRRPLETITGGPSLISMHGETWKRWRALFNPGFNPTYLTGLAPLIADEVAVFCEKLRERARNGGMFLLEPLTLRLTVDTICSVTLDARLHHQAKDHPLATALQRQIEWASFGTTFNPFKRYFTIRPLVLWYNNRLMNRFIDAEIDRAYHAQSDQPSKSVIDLALKQYMKERAETQAGEDSARSLEEFKRRVAPQLRVFLFAGRDTTSSTLLYTFYLLARHPEVLKKVREEHNQVFGTDYRQIHAQIREDAQLLNQLPYTLAVIKETLRLFPPSASMREGRPDVEIIGDDGRRYPTAGCNVWTLTVALHHNGAHWREVESFIPERWLVGPEDPLYPVKGAWRAFEFGPRSCIGQTLALLELRIALVMTLTEFEVVPAYEEWDRLHPRSTVKEVNGHRAYQAEKGGGGAHPADGVPCRVTLRS
ncbi:cytochrome P450 [Aspergillus lucknowensis]|uniref:Cytochrome P450 n=1 Tax=Aspergillus lucknowensis TaxID=176173 RepID=A0ABR4LSJ4_9EURO